MTQTQSHTKAWITSPTGYAGTELPKGACVLIAEDQKTFYPEAIRVIYRDKTLLVYPEYLTLDPMQIQ